jgi:HSP20 family molecular chaperone IbpA
MMPRDPSTKSEDTIDPTTPAMRATRTTIPLEVSETDESVVVRAELPDVPGVRAVRAEDVRVSIHGDTLTVQADRPPALGTGAAMGGPWLAPHPDALLAAHFEGTISLPTPVRALEAKAAVDGSTLTVTVPKARSEAEADVVRQDRLRAEEAARTQRDHESDEVTKESESSFPASDAPSWTGERT